MKLKDLGSMFLRSMYIGDIAKEIAAIDLELDADELLEAYNHATKHVLDLHTTNKALKLMLPLFGKPEGWLVEVRAFDDKGKDSWIHVRGLQWKVQELNKAAMGCNILSANKIWYHSISRMVKDITVYTQIDFHPSCFYYTEDPKVWQTRIAAKVKQRQVRETIKTLDGK